MGDALRLRAGLLENERGSAAPKALDRERNNSIMTCDFAFNGAAARRAPRGPTRRIRPKCPRRNARFWRIVQEGSSEHASGRARCRTRRVVSSLRRPWAGRQAAIGLRSFHCDHNLPETGHLRPAKLMPGARLPRRPTRRSQPSCPGRAQVRKSLQEGCLEWLTSANAGNLCCGEVERLVNLARR